MSFTRSVGTPPPWYGVNPIRTNVTSDYTAQPYDYYIGVNGVGVTITIPPGAGLVQGKTYVIKDESGQASINRITVTAPDGIDGSTTITMVQSYMALTLFWTGTFWSII